MALPIDVVPGTNPPAFRWTHRGNAAVLCEGSLSASAEPAVVELIALVKQQARELEALRKQPKPHAVSPVPTKRGKP